jgi:hypothetical protein
MSKETRAPVYISEGCTGWTNQHSKVAKEWLKWLTKSMEKERLATKVSEGDGWAQYICEVSGTLGKFRICAQVYCSKAASVPNKEPQFAVQFTLNMEWFRPVFLFSQHVPALHRCVQCLFREIV